MDSDHRLRIDSTGSAPVHVVLVFGPVVNALRAGVPFDNPFVVVTGLMGETFDREIISGFDLDDRFKRFAEITPMHRFVRGWQ
jgi:hypothetical protein